MMRPVVIVRAPDGGEYKTVADVEIGAAIFVSEIKWVQYVISGRKGLRTLAEIIGTGPGERRLDLKALVEAAIQSNHQRIVVGVHRVGDGGNGLNGVIRAPGAGLGPRSTGGHAEIWNRELLSVEGPSDSRVSSG